MVTFEDLAMIFDMSIIAHLQMTASKSSKPCLCGIAKNLSLLEGYIRFIKLYAGIQGTNIDSLRHTRRVHREHLYGLIIVIGLERRIHLLATPQICDLVQR